MDSLAALSELRLTNRTAKQLSLRDQKICDGGSGRNSSVKPPILASKFVAEQNRYRFERGQLPPSSIALTSANGSPTTLK